tara:strand:+ start:3153 stop:3917 length:765 start_codon:yes stop_codon:yes gene_type:complete
MPTALINQPAGLGDILFTIKIGCHFHQQGVRVIWPISPSYKCLENKIKTNHIEFYSLDNSFPFKEEFESLSSSDISEVTLYQKKILYIPLTRGFYSKAAKLINGYEKSNMFGKYAMCGLHPSNWQNYFSLNRDKQKEDKLFSELKIEKPYHLVNARFGTPPQWEVYLNKVVKTPSDLQRVEIKLKENYNVFDWAKVIEEAAKIDTVATSMPFIFEVLNLKCNPTIHSRNKTDDEALENFKLMKEIYKKDYKYEI